jgi:hypothetical protein
MDINKQAIDVCQAVEMEERLAGGKDLGGKPTCIKQTPDASEHTRVIIYHRYHLWPYWHIVPGFCAARGVVDQRRACSAEPLIPRFTVARYCT